MLKPRRPILSGNAILVGAHDRLSDFQIAGDSKKCSKLPKNRNPANGIVGGPANINFIFPNGDVGASINMRAPQDPFLCLAIKVEPTRFGPVFKDRENPAWPGRVQNKIVVVRSNPNLLEVRRDYATAQALRIFFPILFARTNKFLIGQLRNRFTHTSVQRARLGLDRNRSCCGLGRADESFDHGA
jgi:hypothetical protein